MEDWEPLSLKAFETKYFDILVNSQYIFNLILHFLVLTAFSEVLM